MGSLVGCSGLRGLWGDVGEANEVGGELSDDVVDGVVNCSVQNGKAAGGMHGGRLGTLCPYDYQKGSVPLDDGID